MARKPAPAPAAAPRPAPSAWGKAAAGVLGFCFLFNLYRAATLSIAHDEALTYLYYLKGPWKDLLYFDTNNHILYTLAAKLCVLAFGASELSLRLPSLAGGALYFWGVYRLSGRLFGSGPRFFAAAALCSLNPLVLDFLCAARGYGPALACMVWALDFMLQDRDREASLALGLSLGFNLAFAVANTGLALAYLLRRRRLTWAFVLPGPLLAAALWAPLLIPAEKGHFIGGLERPLQSLEQLVEASFFRPETAVVQLAPAAPAPALRRALTWAGAAAVLALLAAAAFAWKSGGPLALVGAGTTFAWAGYLLFHVLSGMKYPEDRMALYAVPLLTLVAAGRPRLGLAAALLVGAAYVRELDPRYFRTWGYDADSRAVFEALKGREQGAPSPVRAGGIWLHEPSMNFYRLKSGAAWLAPFERELEPEPRGHDYFVYAPADLPKADPSILKTVYRGPVSGVVLATVSAGLDGPVFRGRDLLRKGSLREAEALFREVLKADPASLDARGQLGVALARQGRMDEALDQFREAVRRHPESSLAHNSLGALLGGLGRGDEALEEYRAALRLQPGNVEALANLGWALLQRGRRDEALRAFRSALDINPKHPSSRKGLEQASRPS